MSNAKRENEINDDKPNRRLYIQTAKTSSDAYLTMKDDLELEEERAPNDNPKEP